MASDAELPTGTPDDVSGWMAQINNALNNQDVHSKAIEILEHGNPLQYIADSCGRMALGAEIAFKKLVCCKLAQHIPTSQGLHPKLSGESGTGKTWLVQVFLHHIPSEMYIKGGLTPKALAYHDFGNRLFIFLDEYLSNPDLDKIIKESSSAFHDPYVHHTVINQKPADLNIGREMTWAISSVDADQNIQILNRAIPLNTDDTRELTKQINDLTIKMYCDGIPKLFVDEQVLICREMFKIIADLGDIQIQVPFKDRIEWLDYTNRRNPSIFMDLLIAITAINCYQRDKTDEGRYLATESDFKAAVALFCDKDAEELVKRFSRKEREMADLLIKYPGGLTRSEIAKIMKISPARVSQIARGEDGKSGLFQKLPGFDIEESTVRHDDTIVKRSLYKLSEFDQLEGFSSIVKLKPGKDGKDELGFEKGKEITISKQYSKDGKDSKDEVTNWDSNLVSYPPKKPYSLTPHQPIANSGPNSALTATYSPYYHQDDEGIGPNPSKFALPLKLKFLKSCEQFVGEDLHKPGEITNYGPYEIGDVVILPKLNATTLILKGVATEAST